jgi:acyl-CoA thioester hydrolase
VSSHNANTAHANIAAVDPDQRRRVGQAVDELASTRPGGWDGGSAAEVPAPLRLYGNTVPSAWVDYNGHMTESAYLLAMGNSSDAFFRYIGIDEAYRASGRSLYTVETHLRNLVEADQGDDLDLVLRLLGVDDKRVHLTHEVFRDMNGESVLVATGEQMLMHVDAEAGRAAPLPSVLRGRLDAIATAHASLPVPAWVGRVMSIPSPAPSQPTDPTQ